MDPQGKMTLNELRVAIKGFKKDAPKLTSKKSDLMAFADRCGLFKKPVVEEEPEMPAVPAKKVKEALPENLKKVKAVEPLPKELKAPKRSETPPKKVSKSKAAPVAAKAPSFAQFMSANKGKGLGMKELAAMYRESKE
jgi:hypothetical protein